VNIKSTPPPVTVVDISALPANFCTKFYRTVKQKNIHLTTKFYLIISENDKIMLFESRQPPPPFLSIWASCRVASRVDYCNSLLAVVPKYTTDKLQRVLVAAAWVITSTRKYDRGLSRLLHEELHWLDVSERILFKLCVFIHQCLNNKAPRYLMDSCSSVATVPGRQRLRSAGCNYLVVPRHRLATYGRRAFVTARPLAWNDLPDELRDISLSRTDFRSRLKTFFSYY